MKAIEVGEYLFLLFTYSGYFLFFLAFTGLWQDAKLYLDDVTTYYKIVVGLVLLYIFNPYIKTVIKPIHERMAFNAGLFLILYSIFRFFIEFFRVPDEQLGYIFLNLTMGQIISLIFILSGVILFYFKNET